MSEKNQLYFGDNLDVLRLHVVDESVDLVYLDPPFNSNPNYNVLFKEHDGRRRRRRFLEDRAPGTARGRLGAEALIKSKTQ